MAAVHPESSKKPNDDPTLADPPPYMHGPPPQHYHPPPPPGMVTVIPGAVVVQQTVGPDPTHMSCPSCHKQMTTRVDTRASMRTHIFAGLLCLFGCWPCVCIPYCTKTCLNSEHYCTNCGAFVGTYVR